MIVKPLLGIVLFSIASVGFSALPGTPFNAKIINTSGQSLYLAQGSPNEPNKPNNPLLCPIFANSTQQQTLNWQLNGTSFPANDPSPDVEVALYLAPANSHSTAAGKQSDPCQANIAKATPVICTNKDGYIKNGAIKFSSYGTNPLAQPPIVTISGYNSSNHTATCTMNTYSYIAAPLPYRQLNVGQNYLPLGAGDQGGNTRTTPLIDLNNYIADFNSAITHPHLPVNYIFDDGQDNAVVGGQNGLLTLRNEELFIQHNISPTWFAACAKGKEGCQQLTHNNKPIPNKFVIWTPVNATLTKGPNANDTFAYTTTFPVIISNAIRAKTVSELVNQRMLWLVHNKKIQDVGTWVIPKSRAPDEAQLAPDGADQVKSDPRDYLAIAVNSSNLIKHQSSQTKVVDLSSYFVFPHILPQQKMSINKVTYQLSANHLAIDPTVLKQYGITPTQHTQTAPIVKLTGIHVNNSTNPVSYLAGHTVSNATLGDFDSASNKDITFTISGNALTVKATSTATSASLDGLYQVNVQATDTTTQNIAYTTFYIYISDNAKNTLANWNHGGLPTFNILHYQPSMPFGSAYLYTSYDFTKSYEQTPWENSMKTLFSDLQKANGKPYLAHVKTAFIDVNNISFAHNIGYWPVQGASGTKPYDLLNSIQANGLVTNLATTDQTKTSLLSTLATFFSKQSGTGVNAALTVYPSNNVKAAFAGFNAQQRNDFVDIAAAPMLYSDGDNPFSGISVDFEGGLNSVGDTQFYKLLTDKLAYRGKWFSYFYFTTLVTPTFVESLGPLGALEISTYDVGTYRTPAQNATIDGTTYDKGINPGLGNTVSLENQGWNNTDINALYTTYANDKTCNIFKDLQDGSASDTSVSWCNNSANQSISENTRMWHTPVKASFQYGSPEQTMQLFHGKFQLVLPVSWSATQWTSLYIWNPDFSHAFSNTTDLLGSDINTWKSGLFMINKNAKQACSAAILSSGNADLKTCLLGNQPMVNGQPVQPYQVMSKHILQIHSLPSTIPSSSENGTPWSKPHTTSQSDYMNANMWVYRNMLNSHNLVGLSAYSLQLYEAIPSSVKAVVVNGKTNMASLQLPWYVGFDSQDVIPGTDQQPGYSTTTSTTVWLTFGQWMQRLADQ